jgi:hypothetical protein
MWLEPHQSQHLSEFGENCTTKTRNTANARKAYDTAKRWADKVTLSPIDKEEISANCERLAAALAKQSRRCEQSGWLSVQVTSTQ